MLSIKINDVEFPLVAMSQMQCLRDEYTTLSDKSTIRMEYSGIDVSNIVSMKEYMNRFSHVNLSVLLPRTRSVRDIVPNDLWRWISDVDRVRLNDLHKAAYTLGYYTLFDLTSLILSEDIDCKNL